MRFDIEVIVGSFFPSWSFLLIASWKLSGPRHVKVPVSTVLVPSECQVVCEKVNLVPFTIDAAAGIGTSLTIRLPPSK